MMDSFQCKSNGKFWIGQVKQSKHQSWQKIEEQIETLIDNKNIV